MFYLFLLLHVALCTRRSTWCHNKAYRIQKDCNFGENVANSPIYMKPIPLIVHPPKTKTEAENHISQTSMFGFHGSFQVCKSSKNATTLSADLHLFGERFSVSVNPLDPIDGVDSLHSATFYIMLMHIKSTEFTQNTWKYHFPKHFQYRSELFSFLRLFFSLKGNCAPTNQSHPSITAREKKQFHQPSIPILEIQSKMQSRASCRGEKSGTGIQELYVLNKEWTIADHFMSLINTVNQGHRHLTSDSNIDTSVHPWRPKSLNLHDYITTSLHFNNALLPRPRSDSWRPPHSGFLP